MGFRTGAAAGAMLLLCSANAARAQDRPVIDPSDPGVSVFLFGGRFANEDMTDAAAVCGIKYEDNAIVGGGVQTFVYGSKFVPGISVGFEAGLAARLASEGSGADSAEFWSGVVARYDGLTVFDTVNISPAVTFGLSAVTGVLPGREAILERISDYGDGDASFLFYVGPEVNLSLAGHEETEVFYRLHHRSGAWGTLGDMEGASNANVFGVRMNF